MENQKTYTYYYLNPYFPRTIFAGVPVIAGAGYFFWLSGNLLSLVLVLFGALIIGGNSGYFFNAKTKEFGSFLSLFGKKIYTSTKVFDSENGYVSVRVTPDEYFQLQVILNRKDRAILKKYNNFSKVWKEAFSLASAMEVSIYDASVKKEKNDWIKPEEFEFYQKQLLA